jgi:twitching motility protein PilJ
MTTTKHDSPPAAISKELPVSPKSRLPLINSLGFQLFLYVLGGAIVGLSALAYLFYNSFKTGVEREIQNILTKEINAVEVQLTDVNRAASSIGMSARALKRSGATNPETYKNYVFKEFFRDNRPTLAMGVSLAQAPNALVPSIKWFYPYFYIDQGAPDSPGVKLPPPDDKYRYSDLFKDDNYPEKEYWTTPTKAGKPVWTDVFDWYGITMTTHAVPFYDEQGKLLGISGYDVNVSTISEQIKKPVVSNAGFFAILDSKGTLAAYPPDPALARALKSYNDVPQLAKVWSQAQEKSGLISIDGTYWAYERLPSNNWLMLASVPEAVVLGPVLQDTILATLGVAALLGIIIALFVRRLNVRLKPILDECNRLAAADVQTQSLMKKQDEIGQLSTSFFNLLVQIEADQAQIRKEAELRVKLQEDQRQTTEAENQVLQEDVGQLLEVVAAVEEGDLTTQAPVSDRVTGLVADTFNRLVEQLARIMAVVSSTAQQVTQSAENLEELAVQTAQQVQQQSQSVESAQALMQNINDLTQDNTKQTQTANESVQQAQNAVVRGQQQMGQLTAGIDTLQKGSEQIVKRVQNLNDFVQLAVQFAKDQKRIASMTRVLSLNAGLLSARATEQQDPEQFASIAREFETVATQVNDLAVQTSQSLILLQQRTDQIQTVVSGLNQDVDDINKIVKDFTTGVGQSRQVFDEIRTETGQVVRVGQQVTQSTVAIAQAAQTTLKSIQEIATLASDTERQVSTTREQSEAMGQLARDLYEMVRFFRIAPEQMQAAAVPKALQPVSANGKQSILDPSHNANIK